MSGALGSLLCWPRSPGPQATTGPGYHGGKALSSQQGITFFLIFGVWKLISAFLLFRKQQQQSQTPVLGDSAASIRQEWWGESFPCPSPHSNHNCAVPSFSPSSTSGWPPAGWRSLGKLPGARAEEAADGAPGVGSGQNSECLLCGSASGGDALTRCLVAWRWRGGHALCR